MPAKRHYLTRPTFVDSVRREAPLDFHQTQVQRKGRMSPKQQSYLKALRELYPAAYEQAVKTTGLPSRQIAEIERTIKQRWGAQRFPSKQTAVREALLLHQGSTYAAGQELRPFVGENRTLTFKSRDVFGNFTARPYDEQTMALAELIERERPAVMAYIAAHGQQPREQDSHEQDRPILAYIATHEQDSHEQDSHEQDSHEQDSHEQDSIEALTQNDIDAILGEDEKTGESVKLARWLSPEKFLTMHQANRAEMMRREQVGEPLDEVSMRPALAARDLFNAGAAWAGNYVLDSYTKTWPEDVRRKMNIQTFGPTAVTDAPGEYAETMPEKSHPALPLILWNLKARNNVYLKGPKGSGKTHVAAQTAQVLGVPWGFSPLTDGASYTWLTGSYSLAGYQTRPFVECFRDGGVFLGDEIDGADANMLLVLNAALSNDEWSNPVTGEIIARHPDFVFIAAANTWGMGADASYRGRNALDDATLDRFASGRIEMGYDNDLERMLFNA